MKETSSRLGLLLLGLILCMSAYLQLTVASRSDFANPLAADAGRYFSYAYNLRHFGIYSSQVKWDPSHDEGKVEPDKIRTPGYPLVLAMLPNPEPTIAFVRRVFLLQALLGVVTVALAFLLAREIVPEAAALTVTALTALSPHLITITAEILTESLFTTLLVAATWTLVRAFASKRASAAVVSGLLWGAAALVRPTVEFFVPLLLLTVVILPLLRPFRQVATITTLAFAVTAAPWIIRNQITDLRATTDNLTVNFLHHGSYPDFVYAGRQETLGFPYRFDPQSKSIGKDVPSALAHIAGRFHEEPGRYLRWYLVGKPISFLSWNIVNGRGDIFTAEPTQSPFLDSQGFARLRDVMRWLHPPLMWLAFAGLILAAFLPTRLALNPPELLGARLVAGLVAYGIALHMIGAPFPRYSIPFRPATYLLAVCAGLALWHRVVRPKISPAPGT
jgi:4-amino-4-deoxy-L-arabinose transferase-like glycosyltransferase